MNPLTIPLANAAPADQDLADQANPGHGIPSQDPNAGAQTPLEPHEAEREANSVLAGGGVIVGAGCPAARKSRIRPLRLWRPCGESAPLGTSTDS